ncbi:MAG: TSUP family transporter, partial [bacterium]|nr:TSUP family transporter [bacterium]
VGTNKVCSVAGSFTSTVKYTAHGQADWKKGLPISFFALFGALLGSHSIGKLPEHLVEPVVMILLVAVTLFVLLQPSFGMKEARQFQKHRIKTPLRYGALCGFGFVIGFHDGFFGPGTGTFLLFVLISLGSLDFLKATGTAKIINFLTNIAALTIFILAKKVDYEKGIVGACGVGIGAFLGTHLAVKKGSRLVRPIFIAVALLIVVKIAVTFFR